MVVVAAFLKKAEVQVFSYLDNWLVRCQSKNQVEFGVAELSVLRSVDQQELVSLEFRGQSL